MGGLAGRQTNRQNQQPRIVTNQSRDITVLDENTPRQVWLRSSKSLKDLALYLESDDGPQKLETVEVFISSLTNRQRLYQYLNFVEQDLLNPKDRTVTALQANLLHSVHCKFSNIFFLWPQLASTHVSAVGLHERMLPELQAVGEAQKLQMLYLAGAALPALEISMPDTTQQNHLSFDTVVKEAIRVNYPFLVSGASLEQLFRAIIDMEVVIEDLAYFSRFITCVLEVLATPDRVRQCREYVERLNAYDSEVKLAQRMHLQKQRAEQEEISSLVAGLIDSGRVFLWVGYPQALEQIFQCVTRHQPPLALPASLVRLRLYTNIYSLFLYGLGEVSLQFQHLDKMSITNIIHLLLRNNDERILLKLRQIYRDAGCQGDQSQFESEIVEYIFSSYCNLQMCLQVVTGGGLVAVDSAHGDRQRKLMTKLNQSKFEVIIQNQNMVKSAAEVNLAGDKLFQRLQEKIEQILEIVRLFYMFGVNEKFISISIFYCPETETGYQSNPATHLQLMEQERALLVFKAFISKFYIASGTKNKKITLNSKSASPLNIDLSKPESIFQISEYMYEKMFSSALKSPQDIHQIIFQHMIYFYRYEEARAILSSPSLVGRYGINVEMLEMIIVNNIIEELQKSGQGKQVLNDINQQLKLIHKTKANVEVQSVKAMVRLMTELAEYGIELTAQERRKMDAGILYGIMDRYADRIDLINFDAVYEEVRAINADEIIDGEQKFMMTNELLRFKSKLAGKAYSVGKKNLGNELIDEISRFNPPWLTTELIEIFKNSNTKIDKRIYGIAMKSCSKGNDLHYLMQLWKEQEGKQRRKEKGFADLTDYFETGRDYLVIDDTLIQNEEKYRNYVAECQFNDEMLHIKKYELFFVLLGTQPERAFHYALKVQLDPIKIDTFLREAMKTSIIDCFVCLAHLLKYFYYAWGKEEIPVYPQYCKQALDPADLQTQQQRLKQSVEKSALAEYYLRVLNAYICSKSINGRFINTYFNQGGAEDSKSNLVYEILFNEKARKTLLIGLREEPMGRSDIFLLHQVCARVLGVNLMELCLFSLANIANTSRTLDQKCQNIIQKIITLSSDKKTECVQIVGKLIDKIFSVGKLLQVLRFMQSRENPLYREIVQDRNLEVMEALAMVEISQQLHGLIPSNFFQKQISHHPVWPISGAHEKILRSCWSKTNIFVLSKVMYFLYGMNPEVENKIWADFLMEHPDEELAQIRAKLGDLGQ